MIGNLLIKICGMRDGENIRRVEDLCPDMMGFIFYDKSKRYLSERPSYLPDKCRRVGVFVDASFSTMIDVAHAYGLDYVQLHGSESPEVCKEISKHGLKVIKAFGINGDFDFSVLKGYEDVCHMYLFDTACAGYGGCGVSFDWDSLCAYDGKVPFLLSGGISIESIPGLRRFRHPKWHGIDINSRFEIAPGEKDITKIKDFMLKLI